MHNRILLSNKRDEQWLDAATSMKLKIILLNESKQAKEIQCDLIHVKI